MFMNPHNVNYCGAVGSFNSHLPNAVCATLTAKLAVMESYRSMMVNFGDEGGADGTDVRP